MVGNRPDTSFSGVTGNARDAVIASLDAMGGDFWTTIYQAKQTGYEGCTLQLQHGEFVLPKAILNNNTVGSGSGILTPGGGT